MSRIFLWDATCKTCKAYSGLWRYAWMLKLWCKWHNFWRHR